MATAQVYLGPELEDLIAKIQDLGRGFKIKELAPKDTVPLGRPKTRFRLTPEQMREIATLQTKYHVLEHPIIVKKMDEFKAQWEEQRKAEEELRQRAKYPQVYYKNSVARRIQEATGLDVRSLFQSGRITKQSIVLEAVTIGLKQLLVQYEEKAKERDRVAAEEAAEFAAKEQAKKDASMPRPRVFDTSGVKAVSPKKKTR